MAFQTGTVENSHSLVERIYGFLLENGWELRATLKSGGFHDYVFYSSGEVGLDDIYIRVAAGESDRQTGGDIQHPYEGGDTEYINAFAYQYFPETGTSGDDGYNELGRYGPVLYIAEYTGSALTGWIWEYNLIKSTQTPRRRLAFDTDYTPGRRTCTFDGKRFLFTQLVTGGDSDDRRVIAADLYDGTLGSNRTDSQWYSASSTVTPYAMTDRAWIYEHIYDVTRPGGTYIKYDIDADEWYTRNS